MNRFSRDIYSIDQAVPLSFRLYVQFSTYIIGTVVSVIVVTPWFGIAVVPIFGLFYFTQKYFIATARELRRISSLMNSPIYSHFSETIEGVDTILAFQKGEEFSKKNKQLIDGDHGAYYTSLGANRWLAVRLELLGNIMVGFACFMCVYTRPSAGFIGVAVSTIMTFTQVCMCVMLYSNLCVRNRSVGFNFFVCLFPYHMCCLFFFCGFFLIGIGAFSETKSRTGARCCCH